MILFFIMMMLIIIFIIVLYLCASGVSVSGGVMILAEHASPWPDFPTGLVVC